ncbi:phosphotransferase family protein [Nocardia sp. NPDC059240]|uniref:phosphotransferase family protein n=1 Tax=Nocardia sp. NPDC059240 TaxID=3346786 RepID=UPI0036C75C08
MIRLVPQQSRQDNGVDLHILESWMDAQGLGAGPIQNVQPIGGGTQNVMLSFERADRRYVFRRGPSHIRPATNNVLRREVQVLDALSESLVPHPRLIASCPDETVLGDSVFYLMEPIEGFNALTELPRAYVENSSLRHDMGLAMVDALAALAAVDYKAVGLEDFGRPDGFLERQVARWLKELSSYTKYSGYDGSEIIGIDEIADWLDHNRPDTWQPGIMHGDYHLANVMFRPDRAEVAAIVDWEMCTIGDPLLDLGWLLATWPHPDEQEPLIDGPLAKAGGLATPQELIERYAARSQRDLSAMTWYTILASFKLGIVLEGTYARACAGAAPRAIGEYLHALTLRLFARARALASGTLIL